MSRGIHCARKSHCKHLNEVGGDLHATTLPAPEAQSYFFEAAYRALVSAFMG
jgi:hypothetical protein